MNIPLEKIFGTYTAWEAFPKTWFINFMNGTQNMYLIEGKDKALLIDTGYGVGNLADFVKTITNKPLIVVNSHFHPDHSAGNGEFEEVYVSKGSVLDANSIYKPDAVPFDISKLPYPDYKIKYLEDNDIIDLGERKIKVIGTKPAHCNSSLFFFDETENLLFCGDEIDINQVLLFDNSMNPDLDFDLKNRLLNFKENILKIKGLGNKCKYLLPNHNGYPICMSYLDDFIALVDAIFDGRAIIDEKLNHQYIEMDPKADKLCRVRFKRVSFFVEREAVLRIMKGN